MEMEENQNAERKVIPRGDLRPKIDLVKSMYVRMAKWVVTEPFGTDPDYAKAVKALGKFVMKKRNNASKGS